MSLNATELEGARHATCPRCGWHDAVITDRPGLDQVLAEHYSRKGLGLIEVCMCADPRQLSVMWNNVFRKMRGVKAKNKFLACPECAFWQLTD